MNNKLKLLYTRVFVREFSHKNVVNRSFGSSSEKTNFSTHSNLWITKI